MSENEEKQQSEAEPEAMGEAQTDAEAIVQVGKVEVEQGAFRRDQAELDKLKGDDTVLRLVLEIHDKKVLVQNSMTTVACPFGNVHMQHFLRGYQSGMELHVAGEEHLIGRDLFNMQVLVDSAQNLDVPRLQWHIGRILGLLKAYECHRAEILLANDILRRTAEIVEHSDAALEEVYEVATEHLRTYQKQMRGPQWVRFDNSPCERLFIFTRLSRVTEIKRLGRRTLYELIDLLERGHFVSGNRRITKVGEAVSPSVEYILWDDWEQQERLCKSNSLMGLIESQKIPIEEWSWVFVPPPADLPL